MTDFGSVDPQQFAALVKGASKDELKAMMAGDDRAKILDEIFARFPSQFRADRAGNTNAVIHWIIGGKADGGSDTYEVVIADGTCTVTATPAAESTLAVNIDGVDFLQLLAGTANPMMMFMTGKLKAKGDLGLAANLAKLFDVQKG